MSLIRVCKPIAWGNLEASEIRETVLKAAAEFYPQLLSSDAVIALRESSRERIAGGEGAQSFLVKIFTAMPEPGSLESCLEEIRRVTEAAGPKNIFLFFPWMDNRPGPDKDIRSNGPLWKSCRSVRAVQYHFLDIEGEKAVSFREIFTEDNVPEPPMACLPARAEEPEPPVRTQTEPYSFYRKSRLSQEELREFFELGLEMRGIKLGQGA